MSQYLISLLGFSEKTAGSDLQEQPLINQQTFRKYNKFITSGQAWLTNQVANYVCDQSFVPFLG